ncbi:DUF2946 domain-containing protein [Rhodoferax sp.]|uniref:DUF2946 domain-containing protein n=1 Tax=Rhodoferax sp. TaxID=50421 RepID=UPI00374CAC2B
MRMQAGFKNLLSWIVCCAILVGAMAPMVSQAMRAASGVSWMEICTTGGAQRVQISTDDGSKSQLPDAAMNQPCAYCSLHLPALGFPPAPLSVQPLLLASFKLPELFLQAPRTLHAWVSAQPRAPPLFS